MKTILALCGVIALAGGVALYRATRPKLVYGQFVGAPAIQIAELIARPKATMGKTWAISGLINKQCTSMGCFFFFQAGDKFLRVELAEIAMHAPRKRDGRKAHVEGQLVPYEHEYQLLATAVEFE